MNLKEAARRLGVHYQTAYRWVRSGELVAVRIGSRYEVSDAAIERLRAQRRALGTPHLEELPRRGDGLEAELAKLADGPMLDVEQAVVHLSRRIAESTGDLCVVARAHRGARPRSRPRRASSPTRSVSRSSPAPSPRPCGCGRPTRAR